MGAAPRTHHLLSVRLHNADYDDLVTAALAAADSLPSYTAYAHFHILLEARDRPWLRELLGDASLVVADGVAVRTAARLTGARGWTNTNATDFHHRLLARVLADGGRVYFLGGSPEAAALLPDILVRGIPGFAARARPDQLRARHGHVRTDDDAVLADIRAFAPDLLMLGLGTPLQFEWIARNIHAARVPLTAATGNFLEFLAGTRARAPLWMRALRLEWLHRLMHEPARLWRRYLLGIPRFAAAILREGRTHP